MKKIIFIYLVLLSYSCSHFLEEYSQDLVVAKTVTDFDELMLGSVYMPSSSYGDRRMPSGFNSCTFLNILDDDINTVRGARVLGNLDVWMYTVKAAFGYFAWQLEVGRSLDGASLDDDVFTWKDLYARINLVNVILTEIQDIGTPTLEDAAAKLRIQGECHFLRAQFYLLLVNFYGNAYAPSTAETTLGVPLKLTGYVEHEQGKPTQFNRASVAEVYQQIVKDLQESIRLLQESPQIRSYYRVSEHAARLLLSRVYLYMQDWENARNEAGELLEINPTLSNMLPLNDTTVFLSADNDEILFSQGSLTLQNVLKADPGDYCVTRELYDLYNETDDKRATVFFKPRGDSFEPRRDSIALNVKFERGNLKSHVSDILMLRNAEAYLNMAEACAMLGDGAANDWLNKLRKTRIANYQDQSYSGSELVEQVRLERRKELCFEGHRWFDLRRYAVNEQYPFKKKIQHVFNTYTDNLALFEFSQLYVLEEDDPAYTFAIPKSVIDADLIGMPDNPREKREMERLVNDDKDFK